MFWGKLSFFFPIFSILEIIQYNVVILVNILLNFRNFYMFSHRLHCLGEYNMISFKTLAHTKHIITNIIQSYPKSLKTSIHEVFKTFIIFRYIDISTYNSRSFLSIKLQFTVYFVQEVMMYFPSFWKILSIVSLFFDIFIFVIFL